MNKYIRKRMTLVRIAWMNIAIALPVIVPVKLDKKFISW
tara:strand:+ start:187 stop:303 length:117 start_codon:yes stop_codon:yes gene_type:complete